MGFTPAAWQAWDSYNVLGKAILTLFLFISHFLIVTILITVLTNSFMAIVSNANEEHQFVFAVNTISMVKNDALFSYVAPSNILAWLLTPLRFMMPFRQYVKINRYVIKITHFPLLFSIYAYERLFLARSVYEPTDLIENRGRGRNRTISFMDPERGGLFSPSMRIRQESLAGYQKDRALDEVFRLTPRGQLRSTMKSQERRSSAVNHWMDQHDGIASPPSEQDRSVVDRLERKRQASRKAAASIIRRDRFNRKLSGTRSVGSDPGDILSIGRGPSRRDFAYAQSETDMPTIAINEGQAQTEDDGDDELLTNDDDENATLDRRSRDDRSNVPENREQQQDYFHTPTAPRFGQSLLSSSAASRVKFEAAPESSPPKSRTPRQRHTRNLSTTTILFNPVSQPSIPTKSSSSASPPKPLSRTHTTRPTPTGTGTHTPTRRVGGIPPSRPRPIMPSRAQFQSAPNRSGLMGLRPFDEGTASPRRQIRHRRSSLDLDITSDMGLPDPNHLGAVPSSFATQMAMATGMVPRNIGGRGAGGENDGSTERMMGRLMLARMKTLEEGLEEVVRGFRDMKRASTVNSVEGSVAGDDIMQRLPGYKAKGKKPARKKGKDVVRPSSAGRVEDLNLTPDIQSKPEDEIIADFTKRGSSF
jgi:hypothetical protein